MTAQVLMWFRNDLRVHDNPALKAAMEAGETRAIYFWCEKQWQSHHLSPARKKLTLLALEDLAASLGDLGVELKVIQTDKFADIPDLLTSSFKASPVQHVFANAEYAIDERIRDRAVKQLCRERDIKWHPYHGTIMQIPGTLKTGQGHDYKVFTPFKKAWYKAWPSVGRSVQSAPAAQGKAVKPKLSLPDVEFDIGPELTPTTEQDALRQLKSFVEERGSAYQDDRDMPAIEGTSRLSAALAVGLVSPVQCFHEALAESEGDLSKDQGLETWVSELIWREFYLNVIYCWPDVCKGKAFRPETDAVAWRYDEGDFAAWCEGNTGFPIVDAAMRQLNETGWMHNRLRMVTAMFLTKYLLIDWRWGERYFMSHLIDGHFAANNGGWQWSASTGTDAAPYFRLLSPIRQGERFDKEGEFIRRYIPELKSVPAKALHKPGCPELLEAGYPAPMVDLKVAREACLAAFKAVKD